jgi:hypothetical protein
MTKKKIMIILDALGGSHFNAKCDRHARLLSMNAEKEPYI